MRLLNSIPKSDNEELIATRLGLLVAAGAVGLVMLIENGPLAVLSCLGWILTVVAALRWAGVRWKYALSLYFLVPILLMATYLLSLVIGLYMYLSRYRG
jgi:hypothetical protein